MEQFGVILKNNQHLKEASLKNRGFIDQTLSNYSKANPEDENAQQFLR